MKFCKSWLIAILSVAFAEEHRANPSVNLEIDNREKLKAIQGYIDSTSLIADVNDLADVLLKELNWFLFNNNIISFDIGEVNFVILGNGIELIEGKLNGINTMARKGNIILNHDHQRLSVQFVIGIEDLTFQYRYFMKTWFGGPTGIIIGTTKGNRVAGDLTFDTTNLKCTNAKIKMETLGNVDIKLKEGILDIFVSTVINIALDHLQVFITGFVNGAAEDVFPTIVNEYNDKVCNISGNCI